MSLDPETPVDAASAEERTPVGLPDERPAEGHAPDEAPAQAVTHSRKHHVAPALIALERVDDDDAFQVRPVGDVAALATDLARLGQLFPVDLRLKPPDRFQIISGFRRVAALRFLQREKVLARLHTDLSDEDALLMALASAIHAEPVSTSALAVLQQRLEEQGRLTPPVKDMLAKALDRVPLSPEHVDEEGEEEVDADELAQDIAVRLGEINQDLSLLADVFDSLEPERKAELLKQLRYSSELVAFLEGR
jgi:ParB family chromosome partitioning protein